MSHFPFAPLNAAASLSPECAEYRPPPWLPNPHLHTIYAALFAPCPHVALTRVRWDTPDQDFIDLDFLVRTDGSLAPLVVVLHGLEGSSSSHYARALVHAISRRAWNAVIVHFRGCSGEPNRLARAYHSGDAAEIDWIIARLSSEHPAVPLLVVGVSLGGNALLKWLGEHADIAALRVAAAAAVSAPLDLVAAGNALDRGLNRAVYTRNFLRSLKRKSIAKLARFPALYDAATVRRAATLRAFDDTVTAPLHGFESAEDYWTRASSKPWLARIPVPTLVLNARDDPFMPAQHLPKLEDVASTVRLEFPAHGGHVGFVTGKFPGTLEWMPERVLRFFSAALAAQRAVHEVMA